MVFHYPFKNTINKNKTLVNLQHNIQENNKWNFIDPTIKNFKSV